jgi:hypothetical protein
MIHSIEKQELYNAITTIEELDHVRHSGWEVRNGRTNAIFTTFDRSNGLPIDQFCLTEQEILESAKQLILYPKRRGIRGHI